MNQNINLKEDNDRLKDIATMQGTEFNKQRKSRIRKQVEVALNQEVQKGN